MEPQKNIQSVKKNALRKPYTPPVIEEIQLLPDENILGGCISPSLTGVGNSSGCIAPTACIN